MGGCCRVGLGRVDVASQLCWKCSKVFREVLARGRQFAGQALIAGADLPELVCVIPAGEPLNFDKNSRAAAGKSLVA